jgi:hypothetical protein
MSRTEAKVGRHDLARVPEPIGGFPSVPTSTHNTARDLTPVAVVDVFDARRRVRAIARIDLLDKERRQGSIDEASYLVGREIERVLEHMVRISGVGQWSEGDRLDPATEAEVRVLLGIERAAQVNAFLAWLARHVGRQDTRLLVMVLGDRVSLSAAAVAFHREGRRGYRYTMDRFRDALSVLAEAKAAKGREVRARR